MNTNNDLEWLAEESDAYELAYAVIQDAMDRIGEPNLELLRTVLFYAESFVSEELEELPEKTEELGLDKWIAYEREERERAEEEERMMMEEEQLLVKQNHLHCAQAEGTTPTPSRDVNATKWAVISKDCPPSRFVVKKLTVAQIDYLRETYGIFLRSFKEKHTAVAFVERVKNQIS